MKILFISCWFPYPPDNGSKIRVFNLIRQLSLNHEVDLVSFVSETVTEERLVAMRRYCRCIDVALYKPFRPKRFKALLGFISQWPRSVIDTYSVEMQRLVERAWRERSPDVVVASEMGAAPYAMTLPDTPRICEGIELGVLYERFSRERHSQRKLRSWLTWWKFSRYIVGVLRAFDGCTVPSEQERRHILRILPGYTPICIVPNGVDVNHYAADFGPPGVDTLVYSGALTYDANFDAAEFFLREILPIVRAERPNVRLSITGKLDGVPIDRLPCSDGVVFTGYVDDVRPVVARSWVCVVPLRVGSGTRLKILEALALGTPVVSTSKGAEGLDVVPGEHLLVADKPIEFADAILCLLGDQALRARLAASGQRLVRERYGWDHIGNKLDQLLHQVRQDYKSRGAE